MSAHEHCWKDQGEHVEETEGWDAYLMFAYGHEGDKSRGGTCFLPASHLGPHEFTDDSEIIIVRLQPSEA